MGAKGFTGKLELEPVRKRHRYVSTQAVLL